MGGGDNTPFFHIHALHLDFIKVLLTQSTAEECNTYANKDLIYAVTAPPY